MPRRVGGAGLPLDRRGSIHHSHCLPIVSPRYPRRPCGSHQRAPASSLLVPPHTGPAAFYKGATARLARVCLDVSVVMVLYEQVNKALDAVW